MVPGLGIIGFSVWHAAPSQPIPLLLYARMALMYEQRAPGRTVCCNGRLFHPTATLPRGGHVSGDSTGGAFAPTVR